MWNEPSKEELSKLPKLYETEGIPLEEKIVMMHFFIGNSDWYIVEFDGEDTFFGYTILGGDIYNAEWGYISYQELQELKVYGFEVEYDEHWKPQKVRDIEKIEV